MNDRKNAQLYVVNGIVCQMSVEGVSYPSVEDVKNHWQFRNLPDVTDEDIEKIICDVKELDEFEKVVTMMSDPFGICSVNPDDY